MSLDPANFISELSVADPPGTDPVSQGDDQIRTTKRATFNSFPNIDAAVGFTASEMNDLGQKAVAENLTARWTQEDPNANARALGFDDAPEKIITVNQTILTTDESRTLVCNGTLTLTVNDVAGMAVGRACAILVLNTFTVSIVRANAAELFVANGVTLVDADQSMTEGMFAVVWRKSTTEYIMIGQVV